MASKVDICNLALSHFGQDANISSIDPPDNSIEAEQCARFYPIALRELLEAHNWTFARKRGTLAALTNDRTDFAYKYQVPSDCLMPRRLLADGYTDGQDEVAVFERDGSYLYTDAQDATLVYTKDLTDTTKFSGLFVTGMSMKLAAYIVGPITKDQTGRTQALMADRADKKIGEAKAADANSERNRAEHTSTAQGAR